MFNGNFNFFGNSIKIISRAEKEHKKMLIDEQKTEKAENVKRITIYPSNVDVKVIASKTSDIEVQLKSYAYTDGKATLDTKLVNDEYIILAELQNANIFIGDITLNVAIPVDQFFEQIKVDGKSSDVNVIDHISANSIDVTTHSGDVTIHKANAREGIQVKTTSGDIEVSKDVSTVVLEINTERGDIEIENVTSKKCIQIKSESGDIEIGSGIVTEAIKIDATSADIDICSCISLQKLDVKTTRGDIEIGKCVFVKNLGIETKSGDVETEAKFVKATVNTHGGDVDLSTDAQQDITLDVTTTKGDVEIDLNHVGTLNLSPKTKSGDIECSHVDRGGYTAEVNVTTISGDIEIL